MKKFNINNYMYIQITDKGWKFLKETFNADYIEHRILKQKIQIKNDIWYRIQCYEVFDIFPVTIGCEPLFEMNVMFDDNDITSF